VTVTLATLSEGPEIEAIHLADLPGPTRPRGFLAAPHGRGARAAFEVPGTDQWMLSGSALRIPADHEPFGVATYKGLEGVLCLTSARNAIELRHERGVFPILAADAPIEAATASIDSDHLAYRDAEGRLAVFDLRARQHLFTLRTEAPT
jgi:hypothetical protein